MAIELRATTESDLDFVLASEADPDVAPFITRWSRERHREAIASADEEHLMVTDDGASAGFALLTGLSGEQDSIEIRRVVVTPRGEGLGRRALAAIVTRAIEKQGAHRVWLDTMVPNLRAQRAYAAAGFVREGVLRDAWREGDRRESLVVMSILAPEWRSRHGERQRR